MKGRLRVSERATGSIYDLGYQRYEGKRLGRVHGFRALYRESLRSAFGFGRRGSSKVFPFGLLVIAAFPAIVQIIIGTFAAGADADLEILAAEDYFEFINIVLALFCAAVAPELVGRDLRNRTLAIYFSRAMGRLERFLWPADYPCRRARANSRACRRSATGMGTSGCSPWSPR